MAGGKARRWASISTPIGLIGRATSNGSAARLKRRLARIRRLLIWVRLSGLIRLSPTFQIQASLAPANRSLPTNRQLRRQRSLLEDPRIYGRDRSPLLGRRRRGRRGAAQVGALRAAAVAPDPKVPYATDCGPKGGSLTPASRLAFPPLHAIPPFVIPQSLRQAGGPVRLSWGEGSLGAQLLAIHWDNAPARRRSQVQTAGQARVGRHYPGVRE